MAELLIVLYIVYLTSMGWMWFRWLARPPYWRWTHLVWSFGVGTILWPYTLLVLNILNIPTRGIFLYFWQVVLVALPALVSVVIPAVVSGDPSWTLRMDSRPQQGTAPAFRFKGEGRLRGNDEQGNDNETAWIKFLSATLLGIALLTAALQALAVPMHMWDSIVIYGFKAKILFQEQTFKTDAFMDPSVLHFSADYPLLIPYLEAGYYRWLGHPDDRVVRLLFLFYWAAWLGILYDALAARIRKEYAQLIVSVVATLPLFSNIYMGQAVSGFADIPLAFYWTGFLVSGLAIWRHGKKAPWAITALFALGCAWTKNEGLVAVLLSGSLLMMASRAQNRRAWILPATCLILMLIPWWWVWHFLPHNGAHYPRNIHLGPGEFLYRLQFIGQSFFDELLQIRSWSFFWPLVLIGVCWPVRHLPYPKESKICLIAVGLQFCVYVYVYLTYRQSLELLMPITMLRLLIHMIGPLTLAVGWRLQD